MEFLLKGRGASGKETAGGGVKLVYDLNKIDFRENGPPPQKKPKTAQNK